MRRYAFGTINGQDQDILPRREGHVGVTAKDNRLFVEAVIYRIGPVSLAGRARTLWRPVKNTYALLAWARSGV